MSILHLADEDNRHSFSNRLRTRRILMFEKLMRSFPPPIRVLDIGGTNLFWEQRGWTGRDDVQITLVNLVAEPKTHRNVDPQVGDATDLREYADASYDIAFSNSTIEHLFTFEKQSAMAREVRRLARAYWVQTPNFWFPMEPHFLVPGWQWLPFQLRVAIIRRWRCGWRGPCVDRDAARRLVGEIRLLTRHELATLFPDGHVIPERFGGIVKSWIVLGGFAPGLLQPPLLLGSRHG